MLDLSLPAPHVAPQLLGSVLWHGDVGVRLTEVEAYAGEADPASHAYHGRTARTAVMFGPPGHVYVYLSYGMWACVNIVCGPDGVAAAVLLRAGEVVAGVPQARERRPGVPDERLARGPGCLGRALGFTIADSGRPLAQGTALRLEAGTAEGPTSTGARVGVSQAEHVPWRFWLTGDPTVSTYKRSPRASSLT